jgi:hypothetical protein
MALKPLTPALTVPATPPRHSPGPYKRRAPSPSFTAPLPTPISLSPCLSSPLTFPLLPRSYRRSPPLPRVTGGRRHHRSTAAPPVSAASLMTRRYSELSPYYSCPARHPINARSRAAGVGGPPCLSQRQPLRRRRGQPDAEVRACSAASVGVGRAGQLGRWA